MTLHAVTTFAPTASESSDRAAGASARSATPNAAFSQTLSKLTQPGAVVTVRPGDTLSGLIQKRLKDTNSPLQLSGDQLYRVALKVAADNGIPNANLIYPEQRIDLTVAEPMAMAEALQPEAAHASGGRVAAAAVNPTAWPSTVASASRSATAAGSPASAGPQAFLAQHAQAARQAQASSGIPATFMVAQAALETGWGKHEIRFDDGRTSHNLFGIRASANWKGPVAEIWTTEYVNGSPQRVRGQFRAYGSYEESFNDYARLISQNPRYANAMRNLGDPQAFAASLQQAGYATAPNYANVLSSVIQTAQRLQDSMPTLAANPQPTTAQMLGMRNVTPGADASWRALNHLPGGSAVSMVGQRQWRQSPYAELDGPKGLP
ncbi:MAG: flagellar assembly peptidoglycan hydrolase FlgJ [Pseudomonadota bacterium]